MRVILHIRNALNDESTEVSYNKYEAIEVEKLIEGVYSNLLLSIC